MLWIFLGLMGCYTPPPVEVETAYISDPCGALSKQITVRSAPNSMVTLHRGDETIAEYETDAGGLAVSLWPSTSLDGVQAWAGRANNHSTAILSDPPPALEPVWRGGRVDHMRCVGLPVGCVVQVDGANMALSASVPMQLRIDGRDAEATFDGKMSTIALSLEDVTRRIQDADDGVDRCRHVTIDNVEVVAGEATVHGNVWLSVSQSVEVYEAVVEQVGSGAPTVF